MSEISKVSELFAGGRPLNPFDDKYLSDVQSILSQNPPETRVNDKANNSLYVPIQVSEELLDFLFPMSWSFEFRASSTIANEVIMDGELVIDCGPIKIKRWGAGAEPIQFKSGAGPLDLDKKISNTLAKDYPNAKAEAFRNACKSLGNVFGRNLSRKNADKTPYQPSRVLGDKYTEALQNAATEADLKAVFASIPQEFQADAVIVNLFKERIQELKTPKKSDDLDL
jgi:hypothetical protein